MHECNMCSDIHPTPPCGMGWGARRTRRMHPVTSVHHRGAGPEYTTIVHMRASMHRHLCMCMSTDWYVYVYGSSQIVRGISLHVRVAPNSSNPSNAACGWIGQPVTKLRRAFACVYKREGESDRERARERERAKTYKVYDCVYIGYGSVCIYVTRLAAVVASLSLQQLNRRCRVYVPDEATCHR